MAICAATASAQLTTSLAKPLSLFVEIYAEECDKLTAGGITKLFKFERDCRHGAIAVPLVNDEFKKFVKVEKVEKIVVRRMRRGSGVEASRRTRQQQERQSARRCRSSN